MLEFEVHSGKELQAAVLAAGQQTYEEARRNPVRITYGRTTYTFKAGLHFKAAERIACQIKKMGVK